MTLRQQIEERERQWRLFHEWEKAQPLVERDASALIADVGAMLEWMPEQARLEDPDPEKRGVQKMFAALSRLRNPA